jgi:hypothetical protein
MRRALRAVHHAFAFESRHGRAAEIAGWSNALAALGFGVLTFRGGLGEAASVAALVVSFALLRLAMAHLATLPLAALAGTLAVAGGGGLLAWTFGHVFETEPAAPVTAGILGALASALAPAWAYAEVARHRREHVPDSLVSPVSSVSSSAPGA